jgi:site-specific recombinase XerD
MDSIYKGAIGFPQQQKEYNIQQLSYNSPAVEYWQNELATLAEGTRVNYLRYFKAFCKFADMTADEILTQRTQDQTSKDPKIQRRIESLFRQFLKYEAEAGYAPETQKTIFACIRSFFEIHDTPLVMRRKDYPKGEANGVRRATKDLILKALEHPKNKSLTLNAIIATINDSGLGVSDLRLLKCDLILDNPNKNLIMLKLLRKKTKTLAKTFLGEESITALKKYIEHRQRGTRSTPPEPITRESPLFRTHRKGTPRPMRRENISQLVQNAFLKIGEKHIAAHSLRKALQTNLEKGGMPTNWIDQVLAHKLINSRDAYSLPTDEELQEAYEKAYDTIRIYPTKALQQITTQPTQQPQQTTTPDIQEAHNIQEVKALLLKGYKIEITQDGTTLMSKPITTSPL